MSSFKFKTPVSKDEYDIYKRYFRSLDRDRCKIVTAEKLKPFMEQSGLSGIILSKVWSLADIQGNGFLNFKEFCAMIRVLSNVINYGITDSENFQKINSELYDIIPNPVFNFVLPERKKIKSPNLPLLTENDLYRYSILFDRTTNSEPTLSGEIARKIFMKAKLSNETLGDIWFLVDREQDGILTKAEFAVAMHLIGLTIAQHELMNPVPKRISRKLWESAGLKINSHSSTTSLSSSSSSSRSSSSTSLSRRSSRTSNRSSNPSSRRSSRVLSSSLQFTSTYQTDSPVITRTLSGSSVSSDMKNTDEATFKPLDDTTSPWTITLDATKQYYKIFHDMDKENAKELGPHILVPFFMKSGLTRDMLANIWDLSDLNKSGFLNVSEFIVATFLINNVKSMRGTLPQKVYPELLTSLKNNLKQIGGDEFGGKATSGDSEQFVPPIITNSTITNVISNDSPKIGLGLQLTPTMESTTETPAESIASPKFANNMDDDKIEIKKKEVDEDIARQIAEAKEAIVAMNEKITESKKKTDEQDVRLAEAQLELNKLLAKKKACEGELVGCKQLEDSLFDRLTNINNSTQENNNKIEKLEMQILESKKRTVQFNQKMSIAEGNYHASQSRLHSIELELEEVVASNKAIENEINNIQSMAGTLEAKLSSKQDELQIYQDKLENNKESMDSKKLNMDELKEKIENIEDQLNNYLEH